MYLIFKCMKHSIPLEGEARFEHTAAWGTYNIDMSNMWGIAAPVEDSCKNDWKIWMVPSQ